MEQPNIVFIQTDQQRYDTIASLGAVHMITPNLDRLRSQSIAFTHAFCCGATCVASRAALYTGMHAHNTGVYHFDQWTHIRTWLHDLRDHGYHLTSIGKVHFHPDESWQGPFHERVIAENFPMWEDGDDYSNYLRRNNQPHPFKILTQDGKWGEKCASDIFPLEEKYHVDHFVGQTACAWIDNYNSTDPFFLHIGFVGPHDPFDPPKRVLDLYENIDLPAPVYSGDDFEQRPPQYRRFMERYYKEPDCTKAPQYGAGQMNLTGKTEADIMRWRKHYFAKITFIDEQIGQLLDRLEAHGLLENSLIIFTSDHGENLGDHQLVYKWLPTEQVARVPFMVHLPGGARGGTLDTDLCSQIDLGPTMLDFAGIPAADWLDGRSNRARWETGARCNIPERVYCRDNYITMVRTSSRKLVHYAGQSYGEYYNIDADPNEFVNLYNNPEYSAEIQKLTLEFLQEQVASTYTGSSERVHHQPGTRKWPARFPNDPYCVQGLPKGRMPAP